MFLKKLDIVSEVSKIVAELETILNINPWTESNWH
jgi:hypothetical protein